MARLKIQLEPKVQASLAKGLKELETGIVCQDNNKAKGRKRSEKTNPQLEEHLRTLVDGKSQADSNFKPKNVETPFLKLI